MNGHVDGVQQRRPVPGRDAHQRFLDPVDIAGEGAEKSRRIVKLHQQELIAGHGGVEEPRHGRARLVESAFHAAAGVKYDAEGNRRVLGGKVFQFLFDTVLV